MIGIYKVIDNSAGVDFCKVSSEMNPGIEAKAYVPPLYRSAVKTLSNGDRVFCVVDDASGYGAILFKFNDGLTTVDCLNLEHDLKAAGNIEAEGVFVGNAVSADASGIASALKIGVGVGGEPEIVPSGTPVIIYFDKGIV